MSEPRTRYSSAPLQNFKRPPKRAGAPQPPRKVGDFQDDTIAQRSFAVLQVLLTIALPVLFVVSLLMRSNTLYIIFALLSSGSLALMWLMNAFVPNARTTLSILHVAMVLMSLFALWMSSPAQDAPAQQAPTLTVGAQEGDLKSIFSQDSSASMVSMTVTDNQAQPSASDNPGASSQAQQQLDQFMAAWINVNYQRMVDLSLPSWAAQQKDPKQSMFQIRANRSPLEYSFDTVSGSDADTTRTISMTVTISKNNGENPLKYPMQVLMVRVNDIWYVDPNSLGSSQPLANAGAATSAPMVTIAPLVTSAPGLPLYFNPDGGTFYHVDANCPSVKASLLPLTAGFLYSQVSDGDYARLEPCGTCHAPRRGQ